MPSYPARTVTNSFVRPELLLNVIGHGGIPAGTWPTAVTTGSAAMPRVSWSSAPAVARIRPARMTFHSARSAVACSMPGSDQPSVPAEASRPRS